MIIKKTMNSYTQKKISLPKCGTLILYKAFLKPRIIVGKLCRRYALACAHALNDRMNLCSKERNIYSRGLSCNFSREKKRFLIMQKNKN